MTPIRVGLVGVGKIALDQHVPSMRRNPAFALVAAASRHRNVDGIANFPTIEAMLGSNVAIDAVAICTPPQAHYDAVMFALGEGKHVLLEKPPCASILQLDDMTRQSQKTGCTVYQTWHSQHAHGVAPAQRWLKQRKILRAHVTWKENVREWHTGQAWIWEAGGFGVFDPGINAISILVKIMPEPFFARSAQLLIPSNKRAPIAADLAFTTKSGAQITATFDFRQTGTQTWDIDIDTDDGPLKLSAGGGVLTVGNKLAPPDPGALDGEYNAIYRRFSELVAKGESEINARPLQLVADLFLLAQQQQTDPFDD